MNDYDRAIEIKRLSKELSEATTRRAALREEAHELAAWIPAIRAAFGNPFFYSHPENADQSVANYTRARSHDVVLPTILALRDVEHEIGRIKDRLRDLGVSCD